ncbi:MAG: hypothetical protein DWB42_01085 [Chloroflexi bacterium]|nr:hypothetical protein [Chloroflexota bacterium]MDL1885123.1 NAD-glutamate dehydrogenase [Anaerolineae bacterium CFX8]
MAVTREEIYRTIDGLPDESLEEARALLMYLQHKQTHPGSAWARTLYDLFAPVREAAAEAGMTEDEINAAIDEAIDEVRRERDS